ncbi:MAG: hypothetical protein JW934_18290 [Anaerolineae bacterium]|nr:hypothetical protein [Anaerolineae bacterium]
MSTYSLDHIIEAWARDDLTAEQVIGQMLLLIQEIKGRLTELEFRVLGLEKEIRRA